MDSATKPHEGAAGEGAKRARTANGRGEGRKAAFLALIGAELRRRRREKGWSLDAAAARIGKTAMTVSRAERGKCRDFDTLMDLADLYECEFLLARKPPKN